MVFLTGINFLSDIISRLQLKLLINVFSKYQMILSNFKLIFITRIKNKVTPCANNYLGNYSCDVTWVLFLGILIL